MTAVVADLLNAALLRCYADRYYGYGRYGAPFWFVGMEEGGGNALEKVRARLTAWDTRGRRELEDLELFHRAFGETRWFDGGRPPIQHTWGRLIRILLAAEGRDFSLESVRRYQMEQLGRSEGNTGLFELLPLPSPSAGHWSYGDWSALPQLVDRPSYREHYASRRAEYLRGKREEHRPDAVIYYSLNSEYQRWWERISEVPLRDRNVEERRVRVGADDSTVFVVIPHPTAPGLSNEFFHSVGRLIRDARKQPT